MTKINSEKFLKENYKDFYGWTLKTPNTKYTRVSDIMESYFKAKVQEEIYKYLHSEDENDFVKEIKALKNLLL